MNKICATSTQSEWKRGQFVRYLVEPYTSNLYFVQSQTGIWRSVTEMNFPLQTLEQEELKWYNQKTPTFGLIAPGYFISCNRGRRLLDIALCARILV